MRLETRTETGVSVQNGETGGQERTSLSLSEFPRPLSTLFRLAAGAGLCQLDGGAAVPRGVERWRLSSAEGVTGAEG